MSSKIKEKSFHKTSKNEKVFSTALLFNMSFFQGSILDNELENQRLNNSSSAIQGDSILNDLLSEELINNIDQLSPIRSNNIEKKMSYICLINREDGNINNKENENVNINIENDKFSSDSSSSVIEIKDNSQIINRKISGDSLLKSFNENNNNENNISENNLIDNSIENNLSEKNLIEKKNYKVKFEVNINHRKNQKEKILNKTFNKEIYIEKEGGTFSKSMNIEQNISQLISYYNSTREYLSHTLREDEDNKLSESLNNSHNFLPKNLINGNNSMINNSNNNNFDFKNINLYNNNKQLSYSNNLKYPNENILQSNLNNNNFQEYQIDNNQYLKQNNN